MVHIELLVIALIQYINATFSLGDVLQYYGSEEGVVPSLTILLMPTVELSPGRFCAKYEDAVGNC